jgi:probable addiction module antidote protein
MIETAPFDPAKYLDTEDSQLELLADAFESGNVAYVADALGVVARARGMSEIAREAGVTREALYKSLSAGGDPKLSTLLGVLKALRFRISIEAA